MKKTYRKMSNKVNEISNKISGYPFKQKYTEAVQKVEQAMVVGTPSVVV